MTDAPILYASFLIFSSAAVIATAVLYTRQSLLVAYLLLGMLLGPWGLKWFTSSSQIKDAGEIGIIFLLFLLGLNLHPQKLWRTLKKTTWVSVISSLLFFSLAYATALVFAFTQTEAIIIGAMAMFSSTIIGLKLLPTTILHHQHTGEVMISVLLLQDILAILVLLFIQAASVTNFSWQHGGLVLLTLPGLFVLAFLVEHFILQYLIRKFDRVKEYVFLLSIGWCLAMAVLADYLGLSAEIGAFIAGVALAASPISLYISESLKPLRDFFLILFFFAVGAGFNLLSLPQIILPSLVLASMLLILKPWIFSILLHRTGEIKSVAREVGVRLGPASEFSLLIAFLAHSKGLISGAATNAIQATTIFTFIVSSYWIVLKYPTPLALMEKMRQD